jgi:hypothetical protein
VIYPTRVDAAQAGHAPGWVDPAVAPCTAVDSHSAEALDAAIRRDSAQSSGDAPAAGGHSAEALDAAIRRDSAQPSGDTARSGGRRRDRQGPAPPGRP